MSHRLARAGRLSGGANWQLRCRTSGGQHWQRVLLVSCCLGVWAGCGPRQSSDAIPPDEAGIKPLTMMYSAYMNSHNGVPPASEADFKRYLAESGDRLLNATGASSVDVLFTSPRDSQPYVVLYGNQAAKLISLGIVAYEQRGKEGRRLVGYRMGFVRELDEAEFRKLIPAS